MSKIRPSLDGATEAQNIPNHHNAPKIENPVIYAPIRHLATVFSFPSSVFRLLSSVLAPLHLSRTLYKSTTFMQNKPNLVRRRRIANECKSIYYKGL